MLLEVGIGLMNISIMLILDNPSVEEMLAIGNRLVQDESHI